MDSVLYVGTDDGVVTLRSGDGRKWETESRGLRGWAVPQVAVVPGSPEKLAAGTRGDGVWTSEDFGKSWKKPSYGRRGPGKVRTVAIDPKTPSRVYAGCEPIDLFVSEDFSANWQRVDSVWDLPWVATVPYPVATVEPHVRDIAIDPNDPDTIYIALQVGYVLKTTDGGETWRLLDNDYDCDVHTIVLHPTDPKKVIVATGGHDARQGKVKGRALYASADGGESWTPAAMNLSQEYSVPLVMHPKNPDILYSALAHGQPTQWKRPSGAESVIIRSKDGGINWEPLETGLSASHQEFPEAIVIDPEDPNRVFAGCRNGDIYISDDAGDSWSQTDAKVSGISHMSLVRA